MALITIVGFPCSGKSTRTAQIHDFIQQKIQAVGYSGPTYKLVVISDDSIQLTRSVYDESSSEKPARGALFTAVQRCMASDTILIVDSLNYIKGFRYQMYCAAREMKLRTCTVFVVASPELCRKWNRERVEVGYAHETLENLLVRFEEPSSMVRWDAPLFTVLWSDPAIPAEDIWEAVTHGVVKPPHSGTLAVTKAPTNALHILEQTTSMMVSAIVAESPHHPSGGKILISLKEKAGEQSVILPARMVTLPELQRLKRQFVTAHKKAITLGTTERGAVEWDEGSVANKFALYLEENLMPQ